MKNLIVLFGAMTLLTACYGHQSHEGDPVESVDLDLDGHDYPSDCNDFRSDVFPGAEEICDLWDNDCDGEVNEGGACTFSCMDSDLCLAHPSEDEVAITLDIVTGCWPEPAEPAFYESNDEYWMSFSTQHLNEGDVINHMIIRQTAGENLPMPAAGGDTARIYGKISLVGTYAGETAEIELGTSYYSDNAFVFEDVVVPIQLEDAVLNFVMVIPFTYAGYIQFGLVSYEDFSVAGKSTVSNRCVEPQLGAYGMVICPDHDGDGQDWLWCGGTDCDDEDPYVNPRMDEIPGDFIDNDCDWEIDETL